MATKTCNIHMFISTQKNPRHVYYCPKSLMVIFVGCSTIYIYKMDRMGLIKHAKDCTINYAEKIHIRSGVCAAIRNKQGLLQV